MKPSEIITADAQLNGLDPQEVMSSVSYSIQNRGGVIIRKNDSLLLLTPIAPNKAEWNLFTQDQNVQEALMYFVEQIKKTDIRFIYGMVDNPAILETMNNIGISILKSDIPEYEWMGRIA